MSIILTIVIPTYNRVNYLKDLLPKLCQQVEKINNRSILIEIIVSDNNSSDGTQEYMLRAANIFNIKYYRNRKNYGAERNFILGIKRSKGEFIWIFGDDDLICENGISRLYEKILEVNSELIIVGEKNYNPGIENSIKFNSIKNYIKYFTEANPKFLLDNTLITLNIFKKTLFNFNEAKKRIPTEYSLMYGICYGLLTGHQENKSIYFLNEPIIEVRKQRAKFAIEPKNLHQKQRDYLFYLSEIANAPILKKYTMQWYIGKSIKTYVLKYLPFLLNVKKHFSNENRR